MSKKWISVAAAAVITAGLVGCGGSDSGSSSSGSSSSTSTQSTKVKGVDGYVMNTKVVVNYWDTETNKTKKVEIKDKSNFYLSADATTKKKKVGSPEYNLGELNTTVLNHIVSIELDQIPTGKLDDGSVYSPSFYDADANGEYNDGDVVIPAGIKLKAPKGYGIITPISTLVAKAVEDKINTDKNETNLSKMTDTYTADIAKALGLDESTLKNVDPISLKDSKDPIKQAYLVANAFAGGLLVKKADLTKAFDTLKKATKPKKAEDVFENLRAAAKDAGAREIANVLEQVKNLVASSKENLETLVKSNLDNTREMSISSGGKLVISALKGQEVDFNLSNVKTREMEGNGYKIQAADLNNVSFKITSNEKNISTKTFAFDIQIDDPRSYVAQDANVSSLTIKVPFEVNATDGTVHVKIPKDAMVKFEGTNQAGTKFFTKEHNASALNITNTITIDSGMVTIKAKDIVANIDHNLSSDEQAFGGTFPAKVEKIKMGIVVDSAQEADGSGAVLSPKIDIVSVGGAINDTVIQMLSFDKNDLVADIRSSRTGANKAPNNELNVSNSNKTLKNLAGNVVGYLNVDTNKSLGRAVLNNNTSYDVNVTAQNVDRWEKNTTVSFTPGSYLKDINLTAVSKYIKNNSAANISNALEVNTTSTTDGNLTTKLTMKTCDEFNEYNTTTAYFVVNRAPELKLEDDDNISAKVSNTDDGNCSVLLYEDHDGFDNTLKAWTQIHSDINSTLVDINVTYANANEVNISSSHTVKVWLESNKTLMFGCTKKALEGNLSANDVNLSIITKNIKDTGDLNISNPDGNVTLYY